jgi:transposase
MLWPPRSREQVARVAPIPRIKFQCFQTLEEGGYNEHVVAIGRKNWTFAGSDEGGRRAAAIYSLIATAKLNDVDPQAWLADVLARLPDHSAKRIDELLPWNWQPQSVAHAA